MLILLFFLVNYVSCYKGRQVCDPSEVGTHITLLKDVFLDCNGKLGQGDVVSAVTRCKRDKLCTVFVVYNGEMTICSYTGETKVDGFFTKPGSWVGISDRLKDFGNCTVNNNVDKVCNAILHTDNMPVRVSSKSNPGKQIMPPFCDFGVLTSNCQPMFWGHDSYKNIGSHLVNTAGPTSPRIRGTSCGISGSIRPDDHNKRFYAGDVVPARPN